MTTLYVGNLPFSATETEIRGLFEQHGTVDSVTIINDRETGRPRGFCFVGMPADDAQRAMAGLNGFAMNGRPLRVSEARERPPRSPHGGPVGGGERW
jgi:RNA recognition motif-containing protein